MTRHRHALSAVLSAVFVFLGGTSFSAEKIPASAGIPAIPAVRGVPVSVPLDDVRMTGELKTRMDANFNRLEEEKFRPPTLFDKPNDGWPGDLEGRTMLGLILLSRATGREPKYLNAIMAMYPDRLNDRGYLGPVMDPNAISEQTLGGQFWVLRALGEYADWKGDTRAAVLAGRLARNLYLPLEDAFASYPITPVERKSDGSQYGSEVRSVGRWRLSSDIGCGFGGLDGLTDLYARRPSPEIDALIGRMIARYREEDPARVQAQMHSTLTAARSVLRHYESTGRKDLLRLAAERYDLYRTRAMTDTHENHNWFGKPWWTEPCAVIDSFILAVQLWRFTGEARYLEDAHMAYFNGMAVEQRANGGFGCNSCALADTPFVEVRIQEAHWCCTGRGAEGLSRAAQYCFFTDDAGIYVPFYQDCEAVLRLGSRSMTVRERTKYPWEGAVRLDILDAGTGIETAIGLFIPSWAENPSMKVNGAAAKTVRKAGFITVTRAWKPGDMVELSFIQRVTARPPVSAANGSGYHTFRYGPLVLAADGPGIVKLGAHTRFTRKSEREFVSERGGVVLTPLYHLLDPAVTAGTGWKRQVLFR